MSVIISVISDYMEHHRRLTIPALGTLLRRGDNSPLIFSEFVTEDDGVLRSLLTSQGASELEAMTLVESFVADVRAEVARSGVYDLAGMCEIRVVEDFNTSMRPISSPQPMINEEADASIPMQSQPIASQATTMQPVSQAEDSVSTSVSESSQDNSYQPTSQPQPRSLRSRCGGVDIWLICSVLVGLFALSALFYGFVVAWQTGDITLPDALDSFMERVFEGGDAADVFPDADNLDTLVNEHGAE